MTGGKFTIDYGNVTEKDLMEYCLNLKHSGYDPMILISFYALGKYWHINKLAYYLRLLKE